MTIRNLVDLPYHNLSQFKNIINLPYHNLSQFKNIVNLQYGDYPILKKLVNLPYGDLTKLRSIVDIPYNIQEQLRNIVDIKYHIIQEQLRNIVNIEYDIQERDHLTKIIELLYVISGGESIQEITTLSVVNENGYTLDPYHINIEKDESDPCISIEIQSNKEEDYEENPEKTKVLVTINSDTYTVLVEEREITNSISQDGTTVEDIYILKLSSPCMLLGEPYADLITEELYGMASDIAAYVVSKESSFSGYEIEWNLIDWYIPEGVYSVSDTTPISILEDLASVAGGIRQSKKDGTLEIRSEYPVDIPDYDSVTPDVYLTDQDNFYSVNSVTEKYQGYNNFLVADEEVSEDELDIQYEDDSSYTKEVRVFQVPWEDDDTISLNTSAIGGITIAENGINTLLIEEEEVEIVDGEGSLVFPYYSLSSSSYFDTDLGDITIDEDGTVTTDTANNTIIIISYYTKYHSYNVTNDTAENVQFWPEIS